MTFSFKLKDYYLCVLGKPGRRCGVLTDEEQDMRYHILRRHYRFAYTCTLCKAVVGSKRLMIKHFKTKHIGVNMLFTAEEDTAWTERMLQRCKRQTKRCTLCTYETFGNVTWHFRKMHVGKLYRCESCDFQHFMKYFVQNHSRLRHQYVRNWRKRKRPARNTKKSGADMQKKIHSEDDSELDSGYMSDNLFHADMPRRSSVNVQTIESEEKKEKEKQSKTDTMEDIIFNPTNDNWQNRMSLLFGFDIFGSPITGDLKVVPRTSPPQLCLPIVEDGNCFFRSLSIFLTGSQDGYDHVRKLLVDFMINRRHEFAQAAVTSMDMLDYVEMSNMECNGTWATEVELYAAASMLQTGLYVFAAHGHTPCWVEYLPLFRTEHPVSEDCAIYMNLQDDHFQPALDV